MNHSNIDFSSILNINDNLLFIETCYETFLERPASTLDLQNQLSVLQHGVSRKDFIYNIRKSKEFHNRFSIPGSVPSKTSLRIRRIWKELCHTLTGLNHREDWVHSFLNLPNGLTDTHMNQQTDSFTIEYDALSLCQISQIASILSAEPLSKEYFVSGVMASDILEKAGIEQKIISVIPPYKFLDYAFSSMSHCFITAPADIYSLLTGDCLRTFASHVDDTFTFTMPFLPVANDSITAFWDESWTAIETGLHGSCSRWFCGDDFHGTIKIYNNSNHCKKVKLSCLLTSLEEQAEIFFNFGNSYKKFTFVKPSLSMDEIIYLQPHYNELPFIYIGCGVTPHVLPLQLLRFSIEQLSITDIQNPRCIYSGESLYSMDAVTHGTTYYPYLLPDSFIRTTLHRNSFFEVQAVLITGSGRCIPMDTTRYRYRSDEGNHHGYYTLTQGTANEFSPAQNGVIIYTAKRTGTLSPLDFPSMLNPSDTTI